MKRPAEVLLRTGFSVNTETSHKDNTITTNNRRAFKSPPAVRVFPLDCLMEQDGIMLEKLSHQSN